MPKPTSRGLDPRLVVLDKKQYVQEQQHIKRPEIVKVLQYGNGWIDVQMNDGTKYRRSGGTLGWRYNNPGNLKYGPFSRAAGSVGPGWGSHAVFPHYEIGHKAKKRLLFSGERKYNELSLIQALSLYAPRSDGNKPEIYTRFVIKRVKGIDKNTKLKHFNEDQREALLRAMQTFEGFREGKIRRL